MTKTNLKVYPLSTQEEAKVYDGHLKYFPDNPFYKKELLIPNLPKDGELFYFILENAGSPVVLMPFYKRRIYWKNACTPYFDISSPYGYSGPLFFKEITAIQKSDFWNRVDQWYRKNQIITEFLRFGLQRNWEGYNGELRATLKNVCGKIRPEQEQWGKFKPKVRNNYRRAVKSGLNAMVYHEDIDDKILSQFCEIYHSTMERRNAGKQYFHTKEYFAGLIKKNAKNIAIAMIYRGELPISTELLLLSDKEMFSYLGGTNATYFSLRPNEMLKIEVLNWGRKKGFHRYCLGGGRIEGDSLYKYKKNFFPKDEDIMFHTGRKILDQKIYKELFEINPFCIDCPVTFFFPKYRCNELC